MAANKKRFGVFENGPSSKKRESLIFFYVLNVLTTHTQNDWIVGRRAVNRPTNMAERLAPKRQLLYISSESDECKATFAWTLLPLQCLFVSIRSFCAYLMPSHWQWQLSNHLSACLAVALKERGMINVVGWTAERKRSDSFSYLPIVCRQFLFLYASRCTAEEKRSTWLALLFSYSPTGMRPAYMNFSLSPLAQK